MITVNLGLGKIIIFFALTSLDNSQLTNSVGIISSGL